MQQKSLIKKSLGIFCLCLVLIAQSIDLKAETPQQIAKKAFPSIVLLMMEDANGNTVALGSGFFVRERVIATNFHVIEGASKGYAKIIGQKTKFKIEGYVGLNQRRDLVLLRVSAPNKGFVPLTKPLLLGNSDVVEIGEQVYAVGNPQGLEGTFSQGLISSIRNVDSNKLLQITAPISSGSSGGPVLNSKGEVVGVSVATIIEGQNLNFAIPVNYLKSLLANESTVGHPLNSMANERKTIESNEGEEAESWTEYQESNEAKDPDVNSVKEIFDILVLSKNDIINLKQETVIAKKLGMLTDTTLQEVESITPISFENRSDIQASTASWIMLEIPNLKISLKELQSTLVKLAEGKEDPSRAVLWCYVMKEFAYSYSKLDYLVDLKLIKNEALARTMSISSDHIFNKILIPRIIFIIAAEKAARDSDTPSIKFRPK
jgi:hypothetical protein